MIVPALFFYLFAGTCVASAVMVIASRNPVHSVLFLILCFFNAAGLFVLMGAEFEIYPPLHLSPTRGERAGCATGNSMHHRPIHRYHRYGESRAIDFAISRSQRSPFASSLSLS